MEQAAVPSCVREQRMIQWIENYSDDIKKICFIYLTDRNQAEDAFQDTFLKAWKSMSAYERKAVDNDKAWLLRIAINTCKDMRRTAWFRNRKNTITFDAIPDCGENDTYSDDTVLQAVMALSDKDKQVILLRYYQDMTVPEVAHVLSISVSSAASRLNRAKGHLRNMLKGWYFDEE